MRRINCTPCDSPSTDLLFVWEADADTLMDELLVVHREATSEKKFYQQAYAAFSRRSHIRRNPEVIECSKCGRLIVFARPGDRSSVMIYVPDTDRWEETYSLRALMEGRRISTQSATDGMPPDES